MYRIAGFAFVVAISIHASLAAPANDIRPKAALTGRVTSDAGLPMEGVLVRAKGAGSTVSVTVATQRDGKYLFPAARLAPGSYTLEIRATGYELSNPLSVKVEAGKATRTDIKLTKTKNLEKQSQSCPYINLFYFTFIHCINCFYKI